MKLRACISSLTLMGASLFCALPAAADVDFTIYNWGNAKDTTGAMQGFDIYMQPAQQGKLCYELDYDTKSVGSINSLGNLYFTYKTNNNAGTVCIKVKEYAGAYAGCPQYWTENLSYAAKKDEKGSSGNPIVFLKYEWYQGQLHFHYSGYNDDADLPGKMTGNRCDMLKL